MAKNIFRTLFPKAYLMSATDASHIDKLVYLDRQLLNYYNRKEGLEYHEQAYSINKNWTPREMPFHYCLIDIVKSGMKIIDLGCGSAHPYLALSSKDIEYVGIDCNQKQLMINQYTYPKGRFKVASLYNTGEESNYFDIVYSLFTLEHLVWPRLFITEMFRLVKPGGYCLIICPNFRAKWRIPSLRQGLSIAPLRDKVISRRYVDALLHIFHRNIYYPLYIKLLYGNKPFLINLYPTCLYGNYYCDNDAIYFVSAEEVIAEFLSLGAINVTDVFRSKNFLMRHEIGLCFVIIQKKY
jgi:ubiquinone/menaquinone biosynthesis C-methylase UbiE